MSGRDHVGAANLFAEWQAAYLQLRFGRVREEKVSGFAAALFVYYDDTVRLILFNVSSMIFLGREWLLCATELRYNSSTSARAERTFAEKILGVTNIEHVYF